MSASEPPVGKNPDERESEPEGATSDMQWNAPSLSSGDPLAGGPPQPGPPPVGLGDTSSMATGPVPPPVGLGDTSSMATGPVPPPAAGDGFASPAQSSPWPASVAQAPPPSVGVAAPSYGLASWGSRVGAALIDGVFVAILAFILAIPLAGLVGATGSEAGAVAAFLGWLVLFLIAAMLYAPVTMMRSGQTPGKKLLGIRVVRDDRQPMSFGYACLREIAVKTVLVGWIGGVTFIAPFINYLWPLWDDESRALHDMLVKSHVVNA